MQDNYYNHMISSFLAGLRQMVTVNEKGTMTEYKTMPQKEWDKLAVFVDSLNDYTMPGGKKNALMKYYSENIYPVVSSGTVVKQGLKKIYQIRIDDYDFRQIISKCESLIM